MKKPDANPVDRIEVDEEAAQLVRFHLICIRLTCDVFKFLVRE